jgi:hypothetical protein
MIHFITKRGNDCTIQYYLQSHGAALAGTIVPMSYDQLFATRQFPIGTYVFADLEPLSDADREQAAQVWKRLANRGCQLLNHPTASMRRFELLRSLHRDGINQFNVYRPGDRDLPTRFPVFLRGEHDHKGSRSHLLHTPDELSNMLARMRATPVRFDSPIIVEYCDTADNAGIFRKYSAFRVGSRILPRHLFVSDQWVVKHWNLLDASLLAEEMRYLTTNPHEQKLREIFTLARIDYGRVDYSLLDGKIQVWEINTNPFIAGIGVPGPRPRDAVHVRFATMLQAAWEELTASPSLKQAA